MSAPSPARSPPLMHSLNRTTTSSARIPSLVYSQPSSASLLHPEVARSATERTILPREEFPLGPLRVAIAGQFCFSFNFQEKIRPSVWYVRRENTFVTRAESSIENWPVLLLFQEKILPSVWYVRRENTSRSAQKLAANTNLAVVAG